MTELGMVISGAKEYEETPEAGRGRKKFPLDLLNRV